VLHIGYCLSQSIEGSVFDLLDVALHHLISPVEAEYSQDTMQAIENLIATPILCPCSLKVYLSIE
jgi:hypothetical protein